MAIFLIRHGETASNAARIVQTPETPLSAHGISQAERLARRLAGLGVAAIVSSDLTRAAMTAQCVRAATGAAIEARAELQERNFGALRGIAYAAIDADIMAPDYAPPDGETWAAFHARIDAAWPRIAATAAPLDGNLAVVTHGLVCYSLALRHLQLPQGTSARQRWANASLTIIDAQPPFAVHLLDCAVHLDPG